MLGRSDACAAPDSIARENAAPATEDRKKSKAIISSVKCRNASATCRAFAIMKPMERLIQQAELFGSLLMKRAISRSESRFDAFKTGFADKAECCDISVTHTGRERPDATHQRVMG
ncbi:hypothetical protein [Bosea psychrotolerans]|uniref:hypothetical protein n=1 Tax=Bosea psychrotolerans TaxID=1871628 RepID=UPI0015E19BC6|nr:hypothetical protein [Bosea psychrotolerans]